MKLPTARLTILLLLTSINSVAQNQLTGKITDALKGTALSGVSVFIPELKTGTLTNGQGVYRIQQIPSGKYLVTVSLVGYGTLDETLTIHSITRKDFSLPISTAALNEVVVTGMSGVTISRKSPVPISTLQQKEMLKYSSSNIIDAISSIPGVSQITEGPAISKPVIRGLGYNRVVVINDGVRQEGQQWGDEFGIEIDENTVNKVEVLKGPASLRYGSDAMAGVINFLAPDPLPDGQIKGSVLTDYHTNNGLYSNSFNLAGNQKGFIWDLRYTYKAAHDYQNKYDGYVWNSGYGENDCKAIIGVTRKWGYAHLRLSIFDLKLGIIEGARDSATGQFTKHIIGPGNSDESVIAPVNEYTTYHFYPIIHQHVRHYKAALDNLFILGKNKLALRLAYQQNYRQEANDITIGDIYNNYFFLQTLNYDAQYILPEKGHTEWSFGVNGMGQSSQDPGLVYLVPEYRSFDIGLYSIVKKTINKLSLTGGLRFDSRMLNAKDLYTDSAGVRSDKSNNNTVQRFTAYKSDFSGISGSLGIAYDFTKYWYGKLNVARGFRAPTIAESGSNGIHDGTPFYEIGDPNLKPENSLQFDATLGFNNENITAELTAFDNNINNYIFPVQLGSVFGGDSIRTDVAAHMSGPAFKYISGNAVLAGGEIMLNIHPKNTAWFQWENSYSFVSAIQKNQGDSTKYLPYTPPQKLQSKLKFTFKNVTTSIQNAFLYIGIENYFKQDRIYYKFGDETVTPGYTLINTGIGADICSKKHKLFSVYIIGHNMADLAYQSNMSRLKYTGVNNVTGRIGVYNMGRDISFKLMVPVTFKH